MHTTEDTDTQGLAELIDIWSEDLLSTTDEDGQFPAWLAERYEAAIRTPDRGYVASRRGEDDVRLLVLTEFGVLRSEARFDLTTLGLAQLAGATKAILTHLAEA